jgi:hypothetical protein
MSMRLRYLLAAALVATIAFPVHHALAFTITEQGGSSSDGSSRIVDPDEQVNQFGWQGQTQGGGYDRDSDAPNASPALNGPNHGLIFPNLFAPLTSPRR